MLILGAPKFQAFDADTGLPVAGGKVYTYVEGTTTNKATYPTVTDATNLTNANANPVILDSDGTADIVVVGATRIVLKDSNDVQIWDVDSVDKTTLNIVDANGNELLTFTSTASAVNHVDIINNVTGSGPTIKAAGDDVNIDLSLSGKGSGDLNINGLAYPAADGTSGQSISTDASGTLAFKSKINKVAVQIFTSSGTYTPTTGMVYCTVEVVGGGGGGGGAGSVGSGGAAAAGGGGGGGYSRKTATAATIGASQTATVGAGGNGGASGTNNGSNGGTTSLGSIASATGGTGGQGGTAVPNVCISPGGAGGVGSLGDYNASGQTGGIGIGANFTNSSLDTLGGPGGSSYLSAHGAAFTVSANGANAPANSGAGGNGGSSGDAGAGAAAASGGNGGSGVIIITEFICDNT